MTTLRGAVIGCGFFAQNHLHAWTDLAAEDAGVRIVAVCDLDAAKAAATAAAHGIGGHYTSLQAMLEHQQVDFVDIVTQVSSHEALVVLAAAHGKHVICQKPFAPDLASAHRMMHACDAAGVSLSIHENFRFQPALRALAEAAQRLGHLHFARVSFRSGHDVFAAQPYLALDERFIISDVGVHTLDLARWLMGEMATVACHTGRVNPAIRGEDVATILLGTRQDAAVVVDMSYACHGEHELFPQTLVWLEAERGSAVLAADYALTVTVDGHTQRSTPFTSWPAWATPPFHAVQASVLAWQRHWLQAQQRGIAAETAAADNIETLRLTEAAYAAATGHRGIDMDDFDLGPPEPPGRVPGHR